MMNGLCYWVCIFRKRRKKVLKLSKEMLLLSKEMPLLSNRMLLLSKGRLNQYSCLSSLLLQLRKAC